MIGSMLWILDESNTAIPVALDLYDMWAEWMHTHDRIVRQDTVNGVFVSTVFLGLSLPINARESGCFETMFTDAEGSAYLRSRTYDDALRTHDMVIAAIAHIEADNG